MKKSLVALAALAVAGMASAQSSVTLFGVVDAAVSGYSNKSNDTRNATLLNPGYVNRGSATVSKTALSNSGYNASRLGFRGTEDLGGGLAASFWLEGALSNDDGTPGGQSWQRRSTVSLSGAFGEFRLGRDYTPTYWNDTVFDPFGANGVGTNLIVTAGGKGSPAGFANGFGVNNNNVRASNSIGYFLPPNLGGFYGQFMYAFHEKAKYDPGTTTPDVADSQRTGRYVGGRVGYANGPLDVAFAYGESTIGDDFYVGTTTKLANWDLGASYDFGVVKLFGEYSDSKAKTDWENAAARDPFSRNPGMKGWLLGATVPVGPGMIRASYGAVKYRNLSNDVYALNSVPTPRLTNSPLATCITCRSARLCTPPWPT